MYNGQSANEFYHIASPDDLGSLASASDEDTYSCSECGGQFTESDLGGYLIRIDGSWVCVACIEEAENEQEGPSDEAQEVLGYIPSFKGKRTQQDGSK